MGVQYVYQERVAATRLEIVREADGYLGSIYYQADDGYYDAGHLDIIFEVLLQAVTTLSEVEPLTRMFLGPFQPVLPVGASRYDKVLSACERFEAELNRHQAGQLGDYDLLDGRWMRLEEGEDLLNDLQDDTAPLSAEQSGVRILLFPEHSENYGWDLQHVDGSTHIGRWNGNVNERPGEIDEDDLSVLQEILEEAHQILLEIVGDRGEDGLDD